MSNPSYISSVGGNPRRQDSGQSIASVVTIVLETLRGGWIFIVGCAAVGIILSIISLAVVPPKWEAKTVVGPVVPDMRYGLSQGISLSAGLSLLGTASGPEGQRFERFLITLHSRSLAERLEQKHHVLKLLFYRNWDETTGTWRKSFSLGNALRRLVGLPVSETPTVDNLKEYLTAHVNVSLAAPQTPNRSITFAFKDRETAMNILRWSLIETDAMIRTSTEANVDKQISYLRNELQRNAISSVENRASLSTVLTEAQKSKILLIGGQPYASETIEAANAPILPNSPNPRMSMLIGLLVGVLLGCGLAWLRVQTSFFESLGARFGCG